MKPFLRITLLLTLAAVSIALLLPQTELDYVKQQFVWLGRGVTWLDSIVPGWDMDHLVAFALLGLSARLALVEVKPVYILLTLLVLAGLTELAQLWVPGRTASVIDATLDVAGGVLGYVVGMLLTLRARQRA
jgi:hypothetical protein